MEIFERGERVPGKTKAVVDGNRRKVLFGKAGIFKNPSVTHVKTFLLSLLYCKLVGIESAGGPPRLPGHIQEFPKTATEVE